METAQKGGATSELDNGQVGNHAEVTQIPGPDGVAEVKGGRADQQIRERNRAAELPGLTLGRNQHPGVED